MTGMGEIFQTGQSGALAGSLVRVLEARETYVRPASDVEALFSTARTAERYEELFERPLSAKGAGAKAAK